MLSNIIPCKEEFAKVVAKAKNLEAEKSMDTLKFWYENYAKFPILSKVAMRILAACPFFADYERVFF